MAKGKKPAPKADKKGGPKVKKPSHKYASVYETSGDNIKTKNKSCPKCGEGYFLAAHKDRNTCGRCGYMEKAKKTEA